MNAFFLPVLESGNRGELSVMLPIVENLIMLIL